MGIFDWVEDCFESLRSLPRKSAWKRYIPMPEVEAINILKRDLPPEAEVTITVEKKGSGWIKIKGAGINESRTFNFKRGVVNSGHMKVDSNKKGIGRHIMRNEIEFFATCGMKRFEICATSAAGGYACRLFESGSKRGA